MGDSRHDVRDKHAARDLRTADTGAAEPERGAMSRQMGDIVRICLTAHLNCQLKERQRQWTRGSVRQWTSSASEQTCRSIPIPTSHPKPCCAEESALRINLQ